MKEKQNQLHKFIVKWLLMCEVFSSLTNKHKKQNKKKHV